LILRDLLKTLILQAKINDRGVAAVAYNVLLRPGVTLGLGASFDTQKMDHSAHKVSTAHC
jgi:voltage-dependent anion channel protein 2